MRDRKAEHRAYNAARQADPVRVARWRQQKRQCWRNNRAKVPVTVKVVP